MNRKGRFPVVVVRLNNQIALKRKSQSQARLSGKSGKTSFSCETEIAIGLGQSQRLIIDTQKERGKENMDGKPVGWKLIMNFRETVSCNSVPTLSHKIFQLKSFKKILLNTKIWNPFNLEPTIPIMSDSFNWFLISDVVSELDTFGCLLKYNWIWVDRMIELTHDRLESSL